MLRLSYSKQAPVVEQVFSHSEQERSMRKPNSNGAGIVPRSRTLIHWIPSANDRWSSRTHLKVKYIVHRKYTYSTICRFHKIWSILKKLWCTLKIEGLTYLLSSTHRRVADSAGMVAKKVNSITQKARNTKVQRYGHWELHTLLIASYDKDGSTSKPIKHVVKTKGNAHIICANQCSATNFVII